MHTVAWQSFERVVAYYVSTYTLRFRVRIRICSASQRRRGSAHLPWELEGTALSGNGGPSSTLFIRSSGIQGWTPVPFVHPNAAQGCFHFAHDSNSALGRSCRPPAAHMTMRFPVTCLPPVLHGNFRGRNSGTAIAAAFRQ